MSSKPKTLWPKSGRFYQMQPESDTDLILCQCDRCGHSKPCFLASDPYLAEVHDEKGEPSWWCRDCYDQRREDI